MSDTDLRTEMEAGTDPGDSGCSPQLRDQPEEMARGRRRIVEGTVVAAALSGWPSTFHALRQGGVRSAAAYVGDATRAAGTLVPPGRASVWRGASAHLAISVACGEALARTLPRRRSVAWGAVGGLAIGAFNVGLIGRRFPAIRALPLLPQLADNVMFGIVFAAVADRGCRQPSGTRRDRLASRDHG